MNKKKNDESDDEEIIRCEGGKDGYGDRNRGAEGTEGGKSGGRGNREKNLSGTEGGDD